MNILLVNRKQNMCYRNKCTQSCRHKQSSPNRIIIIPIKLWIEHNTTSDSRNTPNKAQIKNSPCQELFTSKTIINRTSTATCNHKAYASIIKANPKTHHLFRMTIKQMINSRTSKTNNRTNVMYN